MTMSKPEETPEALSQEDRDVRAALVLASLRYEILEPDPFDELRAMKQAILSDCNSRDNNKLSKKRKAPAPKPKLQLPTGLPDYPPIQPLWNFGTISQPLHKILTDSDVKVDQARLLLGPPVFAKTHFRGLLKGDEDVKKGVRVIVYGPDGKAFNMTFKLWNDKSYYVLNKGWKEFPH